MESEDDEDDESPASKRSKSRSTATKAKSKKPPPKSKPAAKQVKNTRSRLKSLIVSLTVLICHQLFSHSKIQLCLT